MDVRDELDDLDRLDDALRAVRDKADWIARYSESPGVKDCGQAIMLAVAGLMSVQAAMVEMVEAADG